VSRQGTYEEYLLKSIRKWRENVVSWLDERQDTCELMDIMKNIYVYSSKDKNSVSGTIIMRGLIMPTNADTVRGAESNVIIKTSYPSLLPFNNSLDVEKAIYENIISKLVNKSYTPGVISYLGTLNCKKYPEIPVSQLRKYTTEKKAIDDSRLYNTNNLPSLLVLERSTGIQLEKFFTLETTAKDLVPVIFIVIYTLWCFANIGLRHNDLHFGNIFVEDVGKEITLFFHIERDKIIKVKTRYIPKIYDFDRGAIRYSSVPRNVMLDVDFCRRIGECNGLNPKYDLFTFIYILHRHSLNQVNIILKNKIKMSVIVPNINWEWYITTTHHLLPYGIRPADDQIKGHANFLESIYTTNWSSDIFEVIRPPASIPKDLIFTLPLSLKPTYHMTRFIKNTPSIAVSKEFLELLSISKIPPKNDKMITSLGNLWLTESKTQYNAPADMQLVRTIGRKILEKLSETIGVNAILMQWLTAASLLLSCYQFIELGDDVAKKMFGTTLHRFIGHVWNMFDNQLPVEIPVCKMAP
jgi:hypothetical protein